MPGTGPFDGCRLRWSPNQPAIGDAVNKITHGVRLTDDQRIDWLRLIRSQNIGPRGIMAQTPQAARWRRQSRMGALNECRVAATGLDRFNRSDCHWLLG
jgi:hypothetical protein